MSSRISIWSATEHSTATMQHTSFCMGPGSLMGTTGFKWAGRDPMDDCSQLWLESWGLTSFSRAAMACVLVFLLAALSQYLTTTNGCQLQLSKAFAKRRLAVSMPQNGVSISGLTFYDPELGNDCSNSNKTCKHAQAEESAVHPERLELLQTQAKAATLSTVERAHPTSVSLPVRPTLPMSVKVGNWTHLGDALMRGVMILLAYLLMLVVMTYDLTLITSIVVGFMTSFFVFGKDTAKVPVSADPCCS